MAKTIADLSAVSDVINERLESTQRGLEDERISVGSETGLSRSCGRRTPFYDNGSTITLNELRRGRPGFGRWCLS